MAKKVNPPPPYGGLLIMYKPVGPTSLDVVRQLKRLTGIRKIGHCGTLDPFADGVLPIALGRATNMIRYMDEYSKVYRVLIHFGRESTTGDLTGEFSEGAGEFSDASGEFSDASGEFSEGSETSSQGVTLSSETLEQWCRDDYAHVKEAIASLTGSLEQITPAFSAAKVAGRPMYEYARRGIEVEGKPRQVEIYSADFVAAGVGTGAASRAEPAKQAGAPAGAGANAVAGAKTWTGPSIQLGEIPGDAYFPSEVRQPGPDDVREIPAPAFWLIVDIHCSKGTYIRTWATDLGRKLGTGAYAARLRRLKSGPFAFEETITLDEVSQLVEAGGSFTNSTTNHQESIITSEKSPLRDASAARPDFPVLELNKTNAIKILQGKRFKLSGLPAEGTRCRLFHEGQFLGIGLVAVQDQDAILIAERMFFSLENFTG